MKKTGLVLGLIGLIFLTGVGFTASQSGPGPSDNQTVEAPAGPPWGGVWRYCRWVNPDSPACREIRKNMRAHWQKMRELRERVWQEMREYCRKNTRDRFCQNMDPQGPCPRCNWHRGF
ncbi:hypothetical protein [Thermosulfurimonas sp.]|uniref:hypothetical protein n=1 Tax=Thermosulfurimonas sp. TaxID=2080236 RepID=UPI0025ED620B|nr:hypothetical protein [Thermosulfurimonas sp.]